MASLWQKYFMVSGMVILSSSLSLKNESIASLEVKTIAE